MLATLYFKRFILNKKKFLAVQRAFLPSSSSFPVGRKLNTSADTLRKTRFRRSVTINFFTYDFYGKFALTLYPNYVFRRPSK